MRVVFEFLNSGVVIGLNTLLRLLVAGIPVEGLRDGSFLDLRRYDVGSEGTLFLVDLAYLVDNRSVRRHNNLSCPYLLALSCPDSGRTHLLNMRVGINSPSVSLRGTGQA